MARAADPLNRFSPHSAKGRISAADWALVREALTGR